MDYLNFCVMSDKEPLSKAMLGKILHQYYFRSHRSPPPKNSLF